MFGSSDGMSGGDIAGTSNNSAINSNNDEDIAGTNPQSPQEDDAKSTSSVWVKNVGEPSAPDSFDGLSNSTEFASDSPNDKQKASPPPEERVKDIMIKFRIWIKR